MTVNTLLISANTETFNMPAPPMGLGLVAAAAMRAGHRVRFLDLMGEAAPEAALADAIAADPPQAIGISIRNVDDQDSAGPRFLLEAARPLVALCKRLSPAPVVLGGAGYSMFPESALAYLGADMGVQGEGESVFLDILARMEAKAGYAGIPGLYVRRAGRRTPRAYLPRLDDWPYPDPALFDPARFGDPAFWLPFQTRRGCPFACTYCSTRTIEGRRIRARSPEAVVRELARWREAGLRRVFFVDNTFNLPPRYAETLCNLLEAARLGLSWRAIVSPCRCEEPLVQAMARAGCAEVSLGFESGSDRVLSGLGKPFSRADVSRSARMLGRAGIRRTGFLLLGGPDETRESVLESLEFVDSLGLEAMKLTVGIRIYPDTRLASQARAEGVIAPADDLLLPRFYIRGKMEAWLRETVAHWAAQRPHWRT